MSLSGKNLGWGLWSISRQSFGSSIGPNNLSSNLSNNRSSLLILDES